MDKPRTAMPAIAGALAIASAGLKLLALLGLVAAGIFMAMPASAGLVAPLATLLVITIPLFILLVLAIIGGIFAIQRKMWGLALAGSIAAFLPFSLLGIASIVLVALSRDEFD